MTIKLQVQLRDKLKKAVSVLRSAGKIPAVLYGHKVENVNLEVDASKFEKVLKEAGENTVVDLEIEGKGSVKTIIADYQVDPIKGKVSHADFHQINMKEKINANIPLKFIGESKLIKEEGGILIHNLSEIEVRCLPDKLIHEIEVDTSVINDFDQTIEVKDLKIPADLEIIGHEPEDVVALVSRPKAEAEPEPVATETATEPATTEEASTEDKG